MAGDHRSEGAALSVQLTPVKIDARHLSWWLLAASLAPGGAVLAANADSDTSDAAITQQIKVRLEHDPRLRDANVGAITNAGVVTLTGAAPAAKARAVAEALAQSVAGVKKVDDEIIAPLAIDAKIKAGPAPPSASARQIVYQTRPAASSRWLTTKVKSKLLADDLAKGLEVEVSAAAGVVALAGHLPTPEDVERAVALAHQVKGVRQVDSSALTAGGG